LDTTTLLAILAAALVGIAIRYYWPRATIVSEHERGLRFRNGRFIAEVGPGRYWLRPKIDELLPLDVRLRQLIVSGQEVLTADRVPLKVSLLVDFKIVDAPKAHLEVSSYRDALYGKLQLALRAVVADRDLDACLAERGEIADGIADLVREEALGFGVEVVSVATRDFMMGAGLRNAYADVIEAKQRGLAALEKARGESAALRSLANAADLFERHPGLVKLRLLHAAEAGSDNRIVIHLDAGPSGSSVARGEADASADDG
jgi:regulator of protease activity HflC (stomatin/prohibitin superfamily)